MDPFLWRRPALDRGMVPVDEARRSPRLPFRAPAVISLRGAKLDAVAEDIGMDGCRLVAAFSLRRGEAVMVTILLRGTQVDALTAAATVSWSTSKPPYRTGLSFARAGAEERARLLREVVARDPSLASAPAPLHPRQRLRLGPAPAPGFVPGRDELTVLRAALAGATVIDLMEAAGPRFREVRAALASLRARGLVGEGGARQAAPPWRELLGVEQPAPPLPEPATDPLARPGRPVRAVCFLEIAREETAHGHLGAAVEWLQRALVASPGDAEISDALEALTVGGTGRAGEPPATSQ